MSNYQTETLAIHAGQQPDPTTGARAVPIYATTSYTFDDADHAARLFALQQFGNIYTRIMNPTTDVFEQRIAALEGGVGAVALASGQAAETLAILNLAKAGDNIVSSTSLYGGTYNLFAYTLPRLGIEVRWVEGNSTRRISRARPMSRRAPTTSRPSAIPGWTSPTSAPSPMRPTPRACRCWSTTPSRRSSAARSSTGRTWSSTPPRSGSAGTGRASAGWWWTAAPSTGPRPAASRSSSTPIPATTACPTRTRFGNLAYIIKLRVQLLRDIGPALSPFNSFLFLQGLETLPLRIERHSQNALAVAKWLESHPEVEWVTYPGLKSHPTYANAERYLSGGFGGIITFGLRGGLEAGRRLINSVKLFSLLANVGDAKSLIIHPASTTHQQLSPEDQRKAGCAPEMVRLSVGIEALDDIIGDLDQAIEEAVRTEAAA